MEGLDSTMRPIEHRGTSFLDLLFRKRAAVENLRRLGLKPDAAIAEVDRQIHQAVHGSILTGEGVTKSGDED